MKKNTAADPFALIFLSDASVTPQLGLNYQETIRGWIDEDTNEDDMRIWFADIGYPLANPNLLDVSDEFRTMLHYWNGAYTLTFENAFIPLLINEDRVILDGQVIIDCRFSEDKLSWDKGVLHFETAMNTVHPGLTGKLVHGKLVKDGPLPLVENVYGGTVLMTCPGESGVSNLKAPGFAALDFFNGSYSIIPLKEEADLPSQLTMNVSDNAGTLLLGTQAHFDFNHFYVAPQAGQNGRWNENAFLFYHEAAGYYGKIQFLVSSVNNKEGKTEAVKGFFGAITKDRNQLDIPNVMGVFHAEQQASLKKGISDNDSNKSSVAGTILAGIALLIATGFSIWEAIKTRKNDKADKDRADALDAHIKLLEKQLKAISKNTKVSAVDILKAKNELNLREMELNTNKNQLRLDENNIDKLNEKIETLKENHKDDPLNRQIEKDLEDAKEKKDKVEEMIKRQQDLKEEIKSYEEVITEERRREAKEKSKKKA